MTTWILKKLGKGKAPILLAGIGLTIVMVFLYVNKPVVFQYFDNKLYDFYLEISHGKETSGAPIIVDLDEASLEEFGQWPWPRYRVALLLEKVRQAGVMSIGLDILFAEADRTSPKILQKELKRDLFVDVQFVGLPEALLDNDEVFAGILANGPYVLGYYFDYDSEPKPEDAEILKPLSLAIIKAPGALEVEKYLLNAPAAIKPLPRLIASANGAGFINTIQDDDGLLRRTPLLSMWNGKVFPNLSLATLKMALGKVPMVLKVTKGGIESLKIANTVIPLDKSGNILLNYRGPGKTFPYYSAAKFLKDEIAPDSLKGKIAFVGTSAAGLMDLRSTPMDLVYPGVEAHATVVDNILAGDFITRPDWAPGLELALVIAFGFLTTFMISLTKGRSDVLWVLLLGVGIWYTGLHFFKEQRIFVSPMVPLLTLMLIFAVLNLLKYLLTEKEKKFFHTAFSKYVSKAVINQLVDSPEKLSIRGEDKEMTILFSDIRSFTSLSEKLSPLQISDLLHDYFTPMTKVVTTNLGTLDKFIGDAMMAFWNAPVDVENHQYLAIKSGMEMIDALKVLNEDFVERYGNKVAFGIGLHAGRASVGNMGSDELFDYTVIGDSVNLASRLEGLSKFYGVELVISETLVDYCGADFVVQELDTVRVKGKEKPISIYTVHKKAAAETRADELQRYNKALQLYKDQKFTDAVTLFKELQAGSGWLLYPMYEERCETLSHNPPGEGWDAVFTHKTK